MTDEDKLREITDVAKAIERLIDRGYIDKAIVSLGYSNDKGENHITTLDFSDNRFRGMTIDRILDKIDKK